MGILKRIRAGNNQELPNDRRKLYLGDLNKVIDALNDLFANVGITPNAPSYLGMHLTQELEIELTANTPYTLALELFTIDYSRGFNEAGGYLGEEDTLFMFQGDSVSKVNANTTLTYQLHINGTTVITTQRVMNNGKDSTYSDNRLIVLPPGLAPYITITASDNCTLIVHNLAVIFHTIH